jgi:hypothetical protein
MLLSVCVYPLIVARQRLGKNPLIIARQRLGRNVTAVTNTHTTIEEFSKASFSMWPVLYFSRTRPRLVKLPGSWRT